MHNGFSQGVVLTDKQGGLMEIREIAALLEKEDLQKCSKCGIRFPLSDTSCPRGHQVVENDDSGQEGEK